MRGRGCAPGRVPQISWLLLRKGEARARGDAEAALASPQTLGCSRAGRGVETKAPAADSAAGWAGLAGRVGDPGASVVRRKEGLR